jgi:acetyl-CoA synthetase
VPKVEGRDIDWAEAVADMPVECEPEEMNAEDPLFILYTSGSTGKPKGVLHTTGGYAVWASMTHEYVFDYRPGQIYWCAADIGWVTGHSYVVYGPLANGATSLMFEGVPNYPDFSRFWQVVDKYQVEQFYAAPTALRALMREGDEWVQRTSRKSLKVLGSVGEPINPEAWDWYYNVVGDARCPIVDTWWQTETGGHMITPLPGAHALKPGSASFPMFGVQPAVVDPAIFWTARPKALWSFSTVGPARCVPFMAITTASSRLTLPSTPASISPAMAADETRMAITGSRGASTT